MNLDDLKDQSKESFDNLRRKVQDSSAYIIAKERYDVLPQSTQKILIIVGSIVLLLVLLMIPISFLGSSSDQMADFDETKSLTRELLKTQRELQQAPKIPPGLPAAALQARVNSTLNQARLLPEQILSVEVTQPKIASMIPSGITSEGVLVKLAQLNLRQIVDIGHSLMSISQSIKLTQMNVNASTDDDHYYDVDYELTSFRAPDKKEPQQNNNRRRRRSRGGN